MLLKCQECELPVSDKAAACPHCGFPLNGKRAKPNNRKKRMRLPNGFGQISEIKNSNLRKPFRAMVSIGKDGNGRPICKLLRPEAYFETYNDAYAALVEFNRNPYDLSQTITLKELYERWIESILNEDPKRNINYITSAWSYCKMLYDTPAADIRPRHIKACLETGTAVVHGKEVTPTAGVKKRIKSVFSQMFDYAIEYEFLEKNYAKDLKLSKAVVKESKKPSEIHKPYTDDEITLLWKYAGQVNAADMILIQCYSGWRPGELCDLKLENINLMERYFIGGSKTDSGKDRKVPIHSKIETLVQSHYEKAKEIGSEYLFVNGKAQKKVTPNHYGVMLLNFFSSFGIETDHKPHDGRVHFVTKAKKYNVDEYAIKRLIGHRIKDITEEIYTKRDFSWLIEEIEKIK